MKTYDLTLRTTMRSENAALAKEWLSGLIDLDACPDRVEIDAREQAAAPSIGENHPAALAFHALTDAAKAVRVDPALVTDLDLGAASDFISHAVHHLAELYHLFIRQERTIEEQRLELIAEHRKFARVDLRNSQLVSQINFARAAARATVEHLAARPLTEESLIPRGATPKLALEKAQ